MSGSQVCFAEDLGRLALTENLPRELLNTVTGQWLHNFETLTLVGQSFLYIKTGRIKSREQAEPFRRTLETLCEVADNVEMTPEGVWTEVLLVP